MECYNLPRCVKGVIFDIDSTLYTCPRYAFEQVDIQIRHFAHIRGIDAKTARVMISSWQDEWSMEHGGKKISLGNTLINFGISIEESIKWRTMLLSPAFFLTRDESLRKCLLTLKRHCAIICVTNNPVIPARKTLEAIGIADIIPDIIGLDTCGVSKPCRKPFETALQMMGVNANECISVGDRYDMDIALPLEMGMGGILVEGVKDVLELKCLIKET